MIDALGAPQSLLVLGGSSDIGVATAQLLARDRTRRVLLAGRTPAALDAAAERVRAAGADDVRTLPFDALETGAHPDIVKTAFVGGDVDVVLVTFGLLGDQAQAEADPAKAVELAMVNYVGAMSICLTVAAALRRQGHGALVVLSSVAGERARRSNFVYGSTKAAIDVFATGLGDALRGSGVRVLVVRPGFVRTKMTAGLTPAPLSTTPEAVATAIRDGLRRGSETVWVPAALRAVMSGLRHLPRPVFRKLPI